MNYLVVIMGFLLNPLFGLVINYKFKNNRNLFYFGISLFLALYAYTIVPTETLDLSRHYEYFEKINIDKFSPLTADYFGFYIVCYILKVLKLSKHLIPFLAVLINYILITKLVTFEIDKNFEIPASLKNLLYIFSIGFGMNYLLVFSGIRYGVANIFFIYGMVSYRNKKINFFKMLIYFILAMCVHKHIIILIIIYFLSNRMKRIMKYEFPIRKLIVIPLILFFSLIFNFKKLLILFPDYLRIKFSLDAYITGTEYSSGSFTHLFLNTNILSKINIIIFTFIYLIFPITYFFLFLKKTSEEYDSEYTFTVIIFYLMIMSLNLTVLVGRLNYTITILIILNIIRNCKRRLGIIFLFFILIIYTYKIIAFYRILPIETIINFLLSFPIIS